MTTTEQTRRATNLVRGYALDLGPTTEANMIDQIVDLEVAAERRGMERAAKIAEATGQKRVAQDIREAITAVVRT